MHPDKRRFSCTAAICKEHGVQICTYVDKKCSEKTRSFHQCTHQHWCDRFAHVHCIRENFLNTKKKNNHLSTCDCAAPVSVSLIDNSKRIHCYFILRHPHENDVCISVYGVQLYLGLGNKCLLRVIDNCTHYASGCR